MPKPTTIAALRTLVAAWTPTPVARGESGVATGVAAIDAALGGGLPRGRITELVSTVPSTGGELVLGALLASTRSARLRVALIDAGDGFVPGNFTPDLLRHLVWVRAHSLAVKTPAKRNAKTLSLFIKYPSSELIAGRRRFH